MQCRLKKFHGIDYRQGVDGINRVSLDATELKKKKKRERVMDEVSAQTVTEEEASWCPLGGIPVLATAEMGSKRLPRYTP